MLFMKKPDGKKLTAALVTLAAVILTLTILFDVLLKTPKFETSTALMNTVVSVNIEGKDSEKTGKLVLNKIGELETRYLSRHIQTTDVSLLNEKAGTYAKTSPFILKLLKKSEDIKKKSDGAFNPLLGKISDMWGFGTEHAKVPDSKALNDALSKTEGASIKINGDKVLIPEGTVLDLGAVGKGIACDEVKDILKESDTKKAVISVGGSIYLYGENEKFNVGVRNPLGSASDVVGTIKLSNTCVSTSGSYERYFEEDGKTYHHILNPKNGYPAESDLVSVTVVSEDGFLSDALSTACFVLGYEKSLPLLKSENAEAIFIYKDKRVLVTENLKGSFELLDKSFKIVQE